MSKTVHVYPSEKGWTVKREGVAGAVFSTKKSAVERARTLVKGASSGQMVVHRKDGTIVSSVTHRLPKVQPPRYKSSLGTKRIEKAVGKIVLGRLTGETLPPKT